MEFRDTYAHKSIIGVFPSVDRARMAVESLVNAGIDHSAIRMVDAHSRLEQPRSDIDHDRGSEHRGGFLRRLFGFDLDRDDERLSTYRSRLDEDERYFSGLATGDEELVIVDAPAEESLVTEIFESNGGRLESEASGRFAESAGELRTMVLREEQAVPVVEERETGEASIRKEVITDTKTFSVPVSHEELVIERRTLSPESPTTSVGGRIDDSISASDQETIRIKLREEQVDIEKRVVDREEVTIGKRRVEETQQFQTELAKEEAKIETTGNIGTRNVKKKGLLRDDTSSPSPLT